MAVQEILDALLPRVAFPVPLAVKRQHLGVRVSVGREQLTVKQHTFFAASTMAAWLLLTFSCETK